MIRIITDSAADLTAQDLAQPGVAVVPMCVTFADDTTVEDDGRMTRDEFFTHLANDPKLPRTSQPSPPPLWRRTPTPNWPGRKQLSSPSRPNCPAPTRAPSWLPKMWIPRCMSSTPRPPPRARR